MGPQIRSAKGKRKGDRLSQPAKAKPAKKTPKRPAKKKRPGRPKAAKQPAKKKRPARPKLPPVDPAHVEAGVIYLVTLLGREKVREAIKEKFGLSDTAAAAVIEAARQHIVQAAGPDIVEMVGETISRLDQCYQMAVTVQDVGRALQVVREKSRVLSLKERIADHADHAGRAGDDSTEPADFAAIRAHLGPLGLGPASAGPVELARLAALEIIRTRRK